MTPRTHVAPGPDDTVDHGAVLAALRRAARAPSVHNSQPWWWAVGDGVVQLHADLQRWLPAADPDGRDLMLSCGAVLHHLRVALAAGGIGTSVRRLPAADEPELVAVLGLRPAPGDGAGDPAVDPAQADAIERRRTDRRRFRALPIPRRHLDGLVARATTQGAHLRPVTDPAHRGLLALAARTAAAEHAADPAYRDELWSRATDVGDGDGVPSGAVPDGRTGAVDAGRTLPMRRFPRATLVEADAAGPDAATLLVLGTSSDDALSRIRAGEALSAVLLHATALGLATCTSSEPLELEGARGLVADDVLAGSLSPQLLLRLGEPPAVGPEPARTLRRPLEDQIEWLPPDDT